MKFNPRIKLVLTWHKRPSGEVEVLLEAVAGAHPRERRTLISHRLVETDQQALRVARDFIDGHMDDEVAAVLDLATRPPRGRMRFVVGVRVVLTWAKRPSGDVEVSLVAVAGTYPRERSTVISQRLATGDQAALRIGRDFVDAHMAEGSEPPATAATPPLPQADPADDLF